MVGDRVVPESRLYSCGQVTLATFLGTPLAGCLLMARNYRLGGRDGDARSCVTTAILATVALTAAVFLLPDWVPNSALPIGYTVGVREWYKQAQGEMLRGHLWNGGRQASWGATVGISLLCSLVAVALIFGVALLLPEPLPE